MHNYSSRLQHKTCIIAQERRAPFILCVKVKGPQVIRIACILESSRLEASAIGLHSLMKYHIVDQAEEIREESFALRRAKPVDYGACFAAAISGHQTSKRLSAAIRHGGGCVELNGIPKVAVDMS